MRPEQPVLSAQRMVVVDEMPGEGEVDLINAGNAVLR
jgi:hypothetical protein